MRPVVVWTGPVAFYQVPGATLPEAYEIGIPCLGDKDPHCPTLAGQYLGADGRRVPTILSRHNAPPEDQVGDILLGAFSAGGSFVKRTLMSEADRARIDVVHLADATYTSAWEDQRRRIPVVDEGFVRYALDAINGKHLFVATASPIPNKTWASGVENLQRLRAEVEKRTGRRFEELPSFYGVTPAPDHVYRLGNVLLAEYPLQPLGHDHPKIAGEVWAKIIRPWLASSRDPGSALGPPGAEPVEPPVDPGDPTHQRPPAPVALPGWAALGVGFALGCAGVYALSRWVG